MLPPANLIGIKKKREEQDQFRLLKRKRLEREYLLIFLFRRWKYKKGGKHLIKRRRKLKEVIVVNQS